MPFIFLIIKHKLYFMARKKHIKDVDADDMALIDAKMKAPALSENYEYVDAYKNQLKALGFKLEIKCKNEKQKEFLNAMKDKSHQICFGIGAPGTGKSFLSLSYALKELKEGNVSRIIMVIPTAPAGGKDLELGYLKGNMDQKIEPFVQSDKETITKILKLSGNQDSTLLAGQLINGGLIKHEFVNFLLGKTLDDAIILVNEAEQYTKENMRLILTRLGENSRFIITGDCEQVNRNSIVKGKDICGLSYIADKLSDLDEVSISTFSKDDIVRNKLITKILERI
jgi:phosphate starvation-inducible PhoH-like protein